MLRFLINPYLIAAILYVVFNFFGYHHLVSLQRERFSLILQSYHTLLNNILINDLHKILGGSNNNPLSFFKKQSALGGKDSQVLPKAEEESRIRFNRYNNNIEISNSVWVIDLFELRKTLDKTIPPYITYNISINHDSVGISKISSQTAVSKQTYNLGGSDSAILVLGIDPNSAYYKEIDQQTKNSILFTAIGSFIIFSLVLFLYLNIRKRINEKIELLENSLLDEDRMNKVLLQKTDCEQTLRNLFIKKATEIYLAKELGIDKIDTSTLGDEINPSQYLFPIALTDKSLTKIDIEILVSTLRCYFADKFVSTAIEFKVQVKELNIRCAKEVFYQLIFSLLDNLIRFMESQSDRIKLISIDFEPERVIITYDSFMINEDTMVMLSRQMLADIGDIFLLSCDKIFSSLKKHDMDYHLFYEHGVNIIEINLAKIINQDPKENIVIQFNPRKNNK